MARETFFTKDILAEKLRNQDPALFEKANSLTKKLFKNKVFIRGIIEPTNNCGKDCFYCALRKSRSISRYCMTKEEVLNAALWAYKNDFGSIVIQSGENNSQEMTDYYISLIREIKKKTDLGITLCLGELPKASYEALFKAGAHRYLLRIETSSSSLYKKIHPQDHSFETRLKCLYDLKSVGYQVGTGVLIGLPFQTCEDLAQDLMFYKEMDIDMIGMGPYIPHEETPLYKLIDKIIIKNAFETSLKMIALSRLMLEDVNIAATTALDILDDHGREKALLAGANVIMPIVTPQKYRKDYKLYENSSLNYKDPFQCLKTLEERLKKINKKIAYNSWGDPLHFQRRKICHR
jgi:biotin synthase